MSRAESRWEDLSPSGDRHHSWEKALPHPNTALCLRHCPQRPHLLMLVVSTKTLSSMGVAVSAGSLPATCRRNVSVHELSLITVSNLNLPRSTGTRCRVRSEVMTQARALGVLAQSPAKQPRAVATASGYPRLPFQLADRGNSLISKLDATLSGFFPRTMERQQA